MKRLVKNYAAHVKAGAVLLIPPCRRTNPNAFMLVAASHGKVQKFSHIIWFIGAGVWWFDAAVNLHYGAPTHALIALVISVLFFFAGIYFRRASHRR